MGIRLDSAPQSRENVRSWLRATAVAAVLYVLTDLGFARSLPPVSLWLECALSALLLLWLVSKALRCGSLPICRLSLPMCAILGASLIATVASRDRRMSLEALLWIAALVAIFFLSCDVLGSGWSPFTISRALLLLVGAVLTKAVWEIGAWHTHWLQARVPEYPPLLVRLRLYGVADHPNLLAGLVNLALPFAVLRIWSAKESWRRAVWLGWLLAADVTLLYTRSRGGWLGALTAIAITVGWLTWRQVRMRSVPARRRMASLARIALTTVAYLGVFALLYFASEVTSPSDYTRSGGSVITGASRFGFWRVALDAARVSPWVGIGPGTYSLAYVEAHVPDEPSAWVANHAHSLVMNTLAEQGAVGIVALAWLCCAIARLWIPAAWHALTAQDADAPAPEHVATGAALAGCLAHMQVDVLSELPTVAVVLMLLFAVLAAQVGELGRRWVRFGRATSIMLVAFVLLGTGLKFSFGRAYGTYLSGVAAALDGNWKEAKTKVERAVALDPGFTFYREQLAYARGVDRALRGAELTHGAPELAEEYRDVLLVQPTWIPNYLNAAWALLEAGQADEAGELLEYASQVTEGWPLASLLSAEVAWRAGRVDHANALLAELVVRDPYVTELAVCRSSVFCRDAVVNIPVAYDVSDATCDRARALTESGRPRDALAELRSIPVTSSLAMPWIERARAHLALGNRAAVLYALRVVDALGDSHDTLASRHLALVQSAFYMDQSDCAAATQALEAAARPAFGSARYHLVAFERVGLPGLLLPDLADLTSTRADVDIAEALADLYTLQGRDEDAAWARERAERLRVLLAEPSVP